MEILISNVSVQTQTLSPSLGISVKVTYNSNFEAPLTISGKLKVGEKYIALVHEYHFSNNEKIELKILNNTQKPLYKNNEPSSYYVNLLANLTPEAIDYMEKVREKKTDKSIQLNFEFFIKALNSSSHVNSHDNSLSVQISISNHNLYKDIEQSDWVRNFSPQLGIGNFLLLELRMPEKKSVHGEWANLYERLCQRLTEIEDAIKNGDWQKALDRSRQFYENLKIGDGKDGHKRFEAELKKLFIKDQHSEEGFKNFLDAIWQLFEYNSKFIHDKDKKGELKPMPLTTKEDAYFAYTLGVALLNVIGKKLNNQD